MRRCALNVRRRSRDEDLTTKKAVLFYLIASAAVVVDQVTKALARQYLKEDDMLTVVPGILSLDLTYNRGGAFGVLPNWAPLFIIVALVAIYAIVRFGRNGLPSRSLVLGLSLLMGGAVGNLIDRVLFASRGVTDFISVYIKVRGRVHAWPTFNFADVAIVLGAILLFYHVYIVEKQSNGQQPTTHNP
jgi:signal peptidase II